VTSRVRPPVVAIVAAASVGHFINDLLQALLPAVYPMIKADFALDFWQIGLITLAGQATASLLQPVVGHYLDVRPQPNSLAIGMLILLASLLMVALADRYALIVAASALLGIGSAIFHPESSRLARLASGGRHGLVQAVFQTGGNAGSALGPLAAALVITPGHLARIAWFTPLAFAGAIMLWRVGVWYATSEHASSETVRTTPAVHPAFSHAQVRRSLTVLMILLFSKFIYTVSLSNYLTFFLIERFGISVPRAQWHLFLFLGAVALGTLAGGTLADRIGPRRVIWFSILGALPFSALLPHANLFWTGVLSVLVGLIIASAFSAILVYALELVPGRVGLVSGLFFGFAFGVGGLGAAALGKWADVAGLAFVFNVCAWLPLIGLLTVLLPPTASEPAKISPS
jgi:FSR family fosmidomycin resistance protein-like MFS transporter